MIVKYSDDFFIQWDVVYPLKNDLNLGVFNFWINDTCYPAKGINITLNSLFNILSSNIEEIKALNSDIGDIPIEKIDFCSFDSQDLIWLDTGELFQFGFGMVLGFNKESERLFYTFDYEKSYSEIILPKGTVVSTLKALTTL
ncbi:Imm42 family immunity protein [Acinetobacter pittii]|uniref:Imm42 family immunity protein n=1 Tax=Acinetobacter pittii TaxID=48296 RepID=UPI002A081CD9|nr:Imm42 family immunity protein [Acinetobacter pittii]MDX8237710.1 Imm42 family immunity protein [Acinetobacter pittii]